MSRVCVTESSVAENSHLQESYKESLTLCVGVGAVHHVSGVDELVAGALSELVLGVAKHHSPPVCEKGERNSC